MLKKRLIFTLLFDNGYYVLSRNFRRQRVGDLQWLKKNYVFSHIAFSIDELIVLNVNWAPENEDLFCYHLKELTRECFIPIAAGGGVGSIDHAHKLLRSGADKIVINSLLFENPLLVHEMSETLGQQCLIASVDLKKQHDIETVWIRNGKKQIELSSEIFLEQITHLPVGELYLNAIDRDGTGQGFRMEMLDLVPSDNQIPVIIAGGAGNHHHLREGLQDPKVDAVATAHLFNFVGNGLSLARKRLIEAEANLAVWSHGMDDRYV